MTSIKRFASGTILNFFTLILTVIISFLMMPYLIHTLGDRWYGLWVIVGSLIGYYGLLDFGLSSANQRFIAKSLQDTDTNAVNRVISSSFSLLLLLGFISLLLTVGLYIAAPHFTDNLNDVAIFQTLIIIMGVKTAITFPFTVFHGVLTAHLRYDISSFVLLFKLILRTSLILLYLSFDYGIVTLAMVTFITELLGYFIIAFCAKKIHPTLSIALKHIDLTTIKALFNYSKYTFIAYLGDILRFKIDTLVIGKFMGLVLVTHYSIAIRLVEYIVQILESLLGSFLPIFTRLDDNNDATKIKTSFLVITEISLFLSLLIIPVIMIVGDVFIQLWMGKEYQDAYIPLLLLCLATLIEGCNKTCITLLYAKAKHSYYAKINIIEGIVNIALSLMLVQKFGLIGIALGTIIPAIINKIIFLPKVACQLIKLPLRQYYLLMGKYFLFALFYYALCFYCYSQLTMTSYLDIITSSVIICAGYILLAITFLFSTNLKIQIKKIVPEAFIPLANKLL